MWKNFKKKSVQNQSTKWFSFKTVLKSIFVVVCVVFVVWFMSIAFSFVKTYISENSLVDTVSNTVGKDMQVDEYGNVNILVMGMWWDWHQWWTLADTIIVASWNVESNSITMVSIPRDLYVSTSWYAWRINSLLAFGYNKSESLGEWASYIIDKVEEISGMEIPYYAIIDFNNFKKFIDDIGGLAINIPKGITDYSYPRDDMQWYETFIINPGWQIIDWATALKYVRSRHSTSDFDRWRRQQLVIMAIKDQILTDISLQDINNLYSSYRELVTTNIGLQEILGLYSVISDMPSIHSFGLTTECSYEYFSMTTAWCILYSWIRENFGGMSVILPMWATASNISNYTYLNDFFDLVSYSSEYLEENPNIIIKNGIERDYAYSNGYSNSGWANKFGIKLKKFGFNVTDVDNSDQTYLDTTIFLNWTGNLYTGTINALERLWIGDVMIVTGADLQDADMEIMLWNSFVDSLVQSGFSYHDVW